MPPSTLPAPTATSTPSYSWDRHPCSSRTLCLISGRALRCGLRRKLWRSAAQVRWQSCARRRWHEAKVHLSGERVGDPTEPCDGGVSDGKRPMEHENKRQINAQSDGGSSECVAANHPATVPDRIGPQNEPHSEPGSYNPGRAERQKSRGSGPTSLRMRRDPERSAPAKQDGTAIDPS